ncbi:MAG TPA: YaeQ family protein [Terriglobia bacterium]|nr:YaeQ family protein [Terriglobia bacterium]
MAQTATIYNLTIDLSNVDRGVYETIELRIARQPSETLEYMLLRVFAYCLEYQEGIALTEGVASGNEPAILVRDMTGRITAWIEVGLPDPARLHRGSKFAERAAVYTNRVGLLLRHFEGSRIHKVEEVPIYALDSDFVEAVAKLIDRRSAIGLSVTEQQIYLTVGGRDFSSAIAEHRISQD